MEKDGARDGEEGVGGAEGGEGGGAGGENAKEGGGDVGAEVEGRDGVADDGNEENFARRHAEGLSGRFRMVATGGGLGLEDSTPWEAEAEGEAEEGRLSERS